MDVGAVRSVDTGRCRNLYLVETGMFDVTGYGAVYLLDGERPAIIETGIGRNTDLILDALEAVGMPPADVAVIAVTHVHLDHAGGAGTLAARCDGAAVVVHDRGTSHLADPARLVAGTKQAVGDQWQYYGDPTPVPEDRIRAVVGGDIVDLGDEELHVIPAPGHAPHQVMYHVPGMDAVFTGDGAGIWIPAVERVRQSTPPPQFDLPTALADLERLGSCDPGTLLYSHFGPAPYSGEFQATYRRVLRGWIRAVDRVRGSVETDEEVIDYFVGRTPVGQYWSPDKARAETRLDVKGALTYLDQSSS